MVLALTGFAMVVSFMTLIMTKRVSAVAGLVIVPLAFAIALGFGGQTGGFVLEGLQQVAPTAIMLMFAILYFGLMIDVGLFDPAVNAIVRIVHGDPLKVVVGTALLALFVSLDGDGSTTYLVTTTAMLPLYLRLGISRLVMASVIMQAGGVMNLLPWGGPTARAATALQIDVHNVFVPLLPGMIVGAGWVVFVAWVLGRRERARLGMDSVEHRCVDPITALDSQLCPDPSRRRPQNYWVNLALTIGLLVALTIGLIPLPVLFMLAFAIALVINYPSIEEQRACIAAHAPNALGVAAVIFAAGVFTGILSGTRMVDAIANSVVSLVPPSLGPHLAVITALLSMPFTFFLSNDAFYFGVVPVLSQAASAYGISPQEIARASLMGQPVHLLSPLVPSTYLLVGLAGVELGDHQRFTLKWTVASTVVMLLIGLALGVVPWMGLEELPIDAARR